MYVKSPYRYSSHVNSSHKPENENVHSCELFQYFSKLDSELVTKI